MALITFDKVLKIITTICNILLVAVKMVTGSDVPDSEEAE